ncbi:glycoside hydrolase family 113 [Ekhidna sp. To15]|uniref:glycoside hydrolase family 113 n=1 Tax=Ekhidna sp. To15 TaxID=3395267 RepID=UPI003F527E4D
MSKKRILWFGASLLISFALILVGIGVLFMVNDFSLSEYFERLQPIIRQFIREPLFWIFLSLPYFIIRLVKFWIAGYQKGSFKLMAKRFAYSFIFPAVTIILLARLSIWHQNSEQFDYEWDLTAYNPSDASQLYHQKDQRIRGMHVFGGIDSAKLQKIVSANIEQIVLVPYAYQEDYNSPGLNGGSNTRRDSLYTLYIDAITKRGLELIIKPHIWITSPSDGKWRADIEMESEEEWLEWESRYERFILFWAQVSEHHDLPYFCVGNEYYISTTKRPQFWESLIDTVRTVYSGRLTYGANWDREYKEIAFWNKLDYIGIQAYFPLADRNYPNYDEVIDGWNKHLIEIDSISNAFNRKVIFTELGYKSTPDAARYPWGWEDFSENIFQRISTKTQAYCYQAFFEKVWDQEWMTGVMIWQWQTSERDNEGNHNFTPEDKPAMNELAKGFKSD